MSSLKKLHCQISLRYILLLFCLSGCWFAYLADVKRRQVKVLEVVCELGGHVWNVDFFSGGSIEPSRSTLLPECFYHLLPERYNYVYVTSPKVDDDKLAIILQLPGIEGLNISSSTITDKGMQMLKARSGLREIQLYNIPTVTEDAILQLKAATNCTVKHDSLRSTEY